MLQDINCPKFIMFHKKFIQYINRTTSFRASLIDDTCDDYRVML